VSAPDPESGLGETLSSVAQDKPDVAAMRAARVAALYRVAKPGYFATLALAGLLMVVLWEPVSAVVLLAWFSALLALTLARIGLHWRYARTGEGAEAARWERRFVLGAFASSALWSYAPIVFFPEADPLRQMALVFVVGGMVIGAAGVYAPSIAAFYAFATLPMASIILQLAAQPGETYTLLALVVTLFAAVMTQVFRDIHHGIVDALGVQLRNQQLLERLEATEGQMRDAIQSFPEGIAVWGPDDRLVVCNDAYARLYGAGRDAAALVGEPYATVVQNAFEVEEVEPQYRDRREDWVARRLERHRAGHGEALQYRTRDGRWWRGGTMRMRGGGRVGVVADITDVMHAQEAYRAALVEEDLVLDTLPVGVAFIERREIVRCNRRFEEMLGYGPGELHGASTRRLFRDDAEWAAAGQEMYRRMRVEGVTEADARIVRKDGSRFWIRVQARALRPAQPEDSAIFVFTDVDARIAGDRALAHSESTYRSLVETSNDLIWSMDAGRRWTFLNAAAVRRIYGVEPERLLGRTLAEVTAPEVAERDAAVFDRVLAGASVFNHETRHLRSDGTRVDLSFNAIPLRDPRGALTGATGTARDISAQKRAAAELYESVEKLRLAVDAADLYYWEWDARTDRLHWGRDPGALLGVPAQRVATLAEYRKLLHQEDRERHLAAHEAAERGEAYRCEYRVIGDDGRVSWQSVRGKPLFDSAGRIHRMIGVSQDVTERKRQEEEVRFLAYHDSLTGLPNRRLLDDRLRQAVYLAQRRDSRVAAMLIDLDDFKRVNDSFGHRAGDAALREVAQRLAGCVRRADTLARHGGDEFVVVFPDLQLETDCQVVAEKILRALQEPLRIDGQEMQLGASIGISIFPGDAGDGESLLRNADAAMYLAKQLGRNHYRFYGR
jgi:diguanylate cyclase (GGDEF)-like protein/PAS domain S-box-containing protein